LLFCKGIADKLFLEIIPPRSPSVTPPAPTPDCASANEVLLLWSGTEVTPASMVSNTEDNCSDPVQLSFSPDFTAAHGSYFAAKIDSCGLEPGSDLSAEEEGTAPRSEEEQAFTTPSDLDLRIYPNPFQRQFTLELDLEHSAPVSVELYSLTGGRVSTLLSGEQLPAGTQRLTIDGSRLPAGIYMLSVSANGKRTTRRVVRMQ
jgi:hypothetical protein